MRNSVGRSGKTGGNRPHDALGRALFYNETAEMKRLKWIAIVQLFVLVSSCNSTETDTMPKNNLYEESQSLGDIIKVDSNVTEKLEALLKTEKFGFEERSEQLSMGYVGFLPAESRPLANKLLNESIGRLITILEKDTEVTKRMILDEFENGLNSFSELAFDTEDRERVCWYYEDLMDIIGLESTNELLNNWMY